ncbi:MAG: hypothetical protein ABSD74_00810 [Rhizomicrobium sp.]|jgi:hypothetical protein
MYKIAGVSLLLLSVSMAPAVAQTYYNHLESGTCLVSENGFNSADEAITKSGDPILVQTYTAQGTMELHTEVGRGQFTGTISSTTSGVVPGLSFPNFYFASGGTRSMAGSYSTAANGNNQQILTFTPDPSGLTGATTSGYGVGSTVTIVTPQTWSGPVSASGDIFLASQGPLVLKETVTPSGGSPTTYYAICNSTITLSQ